MGTLLSYSGITTKIRAMESQLFTERQYQELAQLTTVPQALAYIKREPGFAKIWYDVDENSLHRMQIEQLLVQSIYQCFTRIYRFANKQQRVFLSLYFKRYEIRIMKECLRKIFDHREARLDLSLFQDFFSRHSKLDLEKLTNSSTIEEFVSNLKGTEYYIPLSHLMNASAPATLFEYGMMLDRYYFTLIWRKKDKIFSGPDLEEITKSYGRKFDMLNLNWIYRSKRYYHMEPAAIYTLLIPMQYKLKKSQISALVESPDLNEFGRILSQTFYSRLARDLTPDTLDESYIYILRTVLQWEARQHPHSVAVLYAYLYQKEHEVNRLTTAIECIRYGVPPEETLRHVMNN